MSKQLFLCHNLNGANNPVYCYHPDHLGTSNALTDANGTMYQFFLNLPFGEPSKASSPTQLNYKTNRGQTMVSQSSTSYYQSEFKFNDDRACKKCPVDIFSDGASMPRWSLLDTETGLYYYGARYYDPSLSIWLSVDPLAEQFPSFSPYNYTMNNPINMVDPDGRAPKEGPGKGWLGRAISTVKGWFSSKNSGYSSVVQSKPKIERFELTLISYEPGESCIGENTNMQTSSDDYSWFSDLFGREPEGMRIWGEGTGGNSTRDDGYSSGPTVETSDLRGMSTSNIRDLRSLKADKALQSNIKSVLEAFNWGLSEAQTAENIITRAVNIFIPAPYQVIRHASNFDSSDNVQWTQDSYDPIRDSTRLMQKRISRGIGRGWYYKAFYVDSVTIKKRD